MDEVTEVERLRARVAQLEAEAAGRSASARDTSGPGRRSAWWSVASAVCITLACVLAPLSVASVWASRTLSDTDRYVETVAPLAEDPAVQDALANEVTTAVFESLDVEAFTTEALTTIASQPEVPPRVAALLPSLAVPISNGVESFTRDQVDSFFASPEFVGVWTEVNRVAHEQAVALLEGTQGGAVSAQDGTITLNIGPIVEAVKERMVDRGFELASNVPEVDRSFVLAESDAITDAQAAYRLLNTLGVWLPVVALALLVAGIALARDRRSATLKAAVGVVMAMVVLGVVLTLARTWYVETTPAGILTAEAAGGVFDTVVRFMRGSLRALAVAGLVVALVAFLAGPSPAAVRTRAAFQGGIGSARSGAESAGLSTGRFGAWVFAHRRALQVATFAIGGLALVFWTQPSVGVVLGVALAVLVVLAAVEFLGTPPAPAVLPASGGPDVPSPRTQEEPGPVPAGAGAGDHRQRT